MKQLRPGMDVTKIMLPTFVLEPRSFLETLGDGWYHADFVSRTAQLDDPCLRMKGIVVWYLAGYYNMPMGIRKPYNPIIGETLRCYWRHPNGSRTQFIAEQVSHHPPISAVYASNRQDGFCLSGTIAVKSKFYGNSTSATVNGSVELSLLSRGETYRLTMPYAHFSGLLLGTVSVELGGRVCIECERSGYAADIEFKLKSMWSGPEDYCRLTGRLRLRTVTVATIDGKWDREVFITDTRTNVRETLWRPTDELFRQRLPRFTVPLSDQTPGESERLWQNVTAAIQRDDQVAAERERQVLVDAQRQEALQRKNDAIPWTAQHFTQDSVTGEYRYRYCDLRPWNPATDIREYEADYRVLTQVRDSSPSTPQTRRASVSAGSGHDITTSQSADSSSAGSCVAGTQLNSQPQLSVKLSLRPLEMLQREARAEVAAIRRELTALQLRHRPSAAGTANTRVWHVLVMAAALQLAISWLM